MAKTTTEMQLVPLSKLVPYINNARTHSPEQITKLRSSLREFGFVNPVIIDRDYGIIAGHGRVMAAKEEGIEEVPCVFVDYLTEAQKKAYIIADNRFAQDAGWDEELLRIEIEALQGMDFDVGLTGFNDDEIADLFAGDDKSEAEDDDFDLSAALEKASFVQRGDIWTVGRHRLMCGDATSAEDVAALKLGIQYRYQQGEVQVNHKRFLGYTKDENKQLVIDPEGAEVVKRIYREYLEGASLLQISRGLEADGILTAAGKAKWRPETLKKILQNEKYIGDALLQKTYTVDFLSKKRVKNNGIVPQYYVENSHEPIIPRELFMQVQEEMVRRANLRGRKGGKKRVYSSKYALSSIVYCGHCGDIYRRVHWNNRGYKSIVWRCVSRLEEKGSECTAPTINEETLQTAVVKAINELLANKEPFLSTLQKNIATVFNEENDNATDDIDGKLEELQQQLLIQAKSKNDYEDVADEIYRLRELKQNALAENAEREGKRQRIAEMTDFLNEQSCELEEYDEQLVRRLIEKVTVFDDKLTVEFKSGVEIDIEI